MIDLLDRHILKNREERLALLAQKKQYNILRENGFFQASENTGLTTSRADEFSTF
jgi:hypothetical protein